MKAKKVLILFSAADLYGASLSIVRSTEGFRSMGWEPVVVLATPGPLVERLQSMGIQVIVMDHGVLRRQSLSPNGLWHFAKTLTQAFFSLSDLIKKENIQLIYSNSNSNFIGGILKIRFGIPHIWHIHEIIEKPIWFKNLLEFYVKSTGDWFICVSEAVRKNHPTIPKDRLLLIYNGIDPKPFEQAKYDLRAELGIAPDQLLIGMIARVNKWKGQKYFLEIASILAKKYPNIHFIMAGDVFPGYEYLYEEVNQAIRDYKLESIVNVLGFRKDTPQILSALDIFVLPSILPDPLPTTVLEAMASGKPVIGTNHGGCMEMIVENETGLLIPWDNAALAAKAFEKLIESEELRTKFGANGQNRLKENFNLEKYLSNFTQVLSKL